MDRWEAINNFYACRIRINETDHNQTTRFLKTYKLVEILAQVQREDYVQTLFILLECRGFQAQD